MPGGFLLVLFLIALSVSEISALDNGVALTPPMGYNSWYDLGCSPAMGEEYIRATADAFIEQGFAKLGYKYVSLDDCWAKGRYPNGTVYPDPATFPSGMKALADYVHSKNLLFGVYTCRGNLTCGRRPGSEGYEKIDANTYASWGVDYLKEDSCFTADATDRYLAYQQYSLMRDSLLASGRQIGFGLCGWYPWYGPIGRELGNVWRIGPDTSNWNNVLTNINNNAPLYMHAGPGGWNNPCLLISTNYQGNRLATELQTRAQFSMWAIMSSPLTISGNVRNMTAMDYATYTNSEVIAVNQDRLGRQGMRLSGADLAANNSNPANSLNVWGRPLFDNSWAVVFINVGNTVSDIVCDIFCFERMGFDSSTQFSVRDLWAHADLGLSNATYTAQNVPAQGGVVMLKFTVSYQCC